VDPQKRKKNKELMFSLKSWRLLMDIENFSAILHIESEALKIVGSYIQYPIQYIPFLA
jgi:hypothetical protein